MVPRFFHIYGTGPGVRIGARIVSAGDSGEAIGRERLDSKAKSLDEAHIGGRGMEDDPEARNSFVPEPRRRALPAAKAHAGVTERDIGSGWLVSRRPWAREGGVRGAGAKDGAFPLWTAMREGAIGRSAGRGMAMPSAGRRAVAVAWCGLETGKGCGHSATVRGVGPKRRMSRRRRDSARSWSAADALPSGAAPPRDRPAAGFSSGLTA